MKMQVHLFLNFPTETYPSDIRDRFNPSRASKAINALPGQTSEQPYLWIVTPPSPVLSKKHYASGDQKHERDGL